MPKNTFPNKGKGNPKDPLAGVVNEGGGKSPGKGQSKGGAKKAPKSK